MGLMHSLKGIPSPFAEIFDYLFRYIFAEITGPGEVGFRTLLSQLGSDPVTLNMTHHTLVRNFRIRFYQSPRNFVVQIRDPNYLDSLSCAIRVLEGSIRSNSYFLVHINNFDVVSEHK